MLYEHYMEHYAHIFNIDNEFKRKMYTHIMCVCAFINMIYVDTYKYDETKTHVHNNKKNNIERERKRGRENESEKGTPKQMEILLVKQSTRYV